MKISKSLVTLALGLLGASWLPKVYGEETRGAETRSLAYPVGVKVLEGGQGLAVGVLDFSKVNEERVTALKHLKSLKEEEAQKVRKTLMPKQAALEKMKAEAEKASVSERKKLENKFQLASQAYQSEIQMQNHRLSLGLQEAGLKFEKVFLEVVGELAKEKKLGMVLTLQGGQVPNVLWRSEDVPDLTEEVILRVNKRIQKIQVNFPPIKVQGGGTSSSKKS